MRKRGLRGTDGTVAGTPVAVAALSPQCPIRPMSVRGVTRAPSATAIESRWVYLVTSPAPWSIQTQVPADWDEVVLQVRSFAPTWRIPAPAA